MSLASLFLSLLPLRTSACSKSLTLALTYSYSLSLFYLSLARFHLFSCKSTKIRYSSHLLYPYLFALCVFIPFSLPLTAELWVRISEFQTPSPSPSFHAPISLLPKHNQSKGICHFFLLLPSKGSSRRVKSYAPLSLAAPPPHFRT